MLAARRTAGTVGAPGGMAEDSGDARWIKADWRVHVQGRTARRPHIDMADDENTEVEEQPKQVEESGGVLDLNSALQQVLKKAAVQPEGLARGLREAVKALDRKVVRAPTLPCVKIERPSVRARLVAGGRQDQQIAGLFCAGCSGGGGGAHGGGWIFRTESLGQPGCSVYGSSALVGPVSGLLLVRVVTSFADVIGPARRAFVAASVAGPRGKRGLVHGTRWQ